MQPTTTSQPSADPDPQDLETARAELERFCLHQDLDIAAISGTELSGRRRRLRNEAVIKVRRATSASYGTLGHLLDADPAQLKRSVKGALELPHW